MEDMVARIGGVIKHSTLLRWIDPLARKLGIVYVVHLLANKLKKTDTESAMRFKRFYEQHREEIEKVSGMLEDDFSRKTLKKVIEYRETGDVWALRGVSIYPQYFQKDIFGPVKDEVFVDGGAYVGDTILPFIKKFTRGGTKKYMLGSQMRAV